MLWLARRVVAAADTLIKIADNLQTIRIENDENCRLSACFVHNICFFLQPLKKRIFSPKELPRLLGWDVERSRAKSWFRARVLSPINKATSSNLETSSCLH
jgi:hypothetical protein